MVGEREPETVQDTYHRRRWWVKAGNVSPP
jgi:hypothetical protein